MYCKLIRSDTVLSDNPIKYDLSNKDLAFLHEENGVLSYLLQHYVVVQNFKRFKTLQINFLEKFHRYSCFYCNYVVDLLCLIIKCHSSS